MADTTIVFCGVRLNLDENSIDQLESRSHPVLVAAKQAGLEYYWGTFGYPDEKYLLFVGKMIGKFGAEDRTELRVGVSDFAQIADVVAEKLIVAGIFEAALLHVHYQPDP